MLPHHRRIFFACVTIGLSLFIGLMVSEIVIRVIRPQNLSGSWREFAPRGYMINKANSMAQHCLSERCINYRFNELHLRGGPIDNSAANVLCLGDSFAFGWLVDEKNCFIGRLNVLAKKHTDSRLEFLNGCAGGWGTADYLAFLEDHGEKIKPKMVLVFFTFMDMQRTAASQLFAVDAKGEAIPTVQKPIQAPLFKRIVNALPVYEWLLTHSHLVQLIRQASVQAHTADHSISSAQGGEQTLLPDSEKTVQLGQALFVRMKRWCEAHQARLLVIGTGLENCYDKLKGPTKSGHPKESPNRDFLAKAPAFFAEQHIPFVDLTDQMTASVGNDMSRYIIPVDLHPNEAGHELLAQHAWEWLKLQLPEVPR